MNIDRMCWIMAALLAVMIVWSHQARAETNVFIGAWSEHLISGDDLNEQHDLFAVEHNSWFAGTFTNSYNCESYAVARKFAWRYAELEGGVYVGAVRGYTRCYGHDDSNTDACPMVAPYITWDVGPVNPQLFLLGEALAISIRIGL